MSRAEFPPEESMLAIEERPFKPRRGREGEPPTGNVRPVEGKCNAANRHGLYCPNQPHGDSARCYFHGARSPRGMSSPHLTHGRYSTALPKSIEDRYERGRNDPNLLALDEDIALLDARLGALLERVDSGESELVWSQVQKLWATFQRARVAGNRARMTELLGLLDLAISKGYADHQAWNEIGLLLDRRQRLVESERKRLTELEQTLTVDEAKLMLRRVLDAVQQHVTDPTTLNAIGLEISRLATADPVSLTRPSRRHSRRA